MSLAIVLAMAASACTSAVDPARSAASSLMGRYKITGATLSGEAYAGQALITPRGDGYDVSWYVPKGMRDSGFGVQVDNVFGVVLSADKNYLPSANVIAYKIADGELTGVRLSGANPDGRTGREVLKGSPDLIGRYEIVLSENPYGATLQSGHVEIERQGGTYNVVWYTPERFYVGTGARMGDVLVVGYGRGLAPGVAAYCVGNGILQGIWVGSGEVWPGEETLQQTGTNGDHSAQCL